MVEWYLGGGFGLFHGIIRGFIRRKWRKPQEIEFSWNVTVHGDAREGKWRENYLMEWVVSNLHTTSEHGVSSITTAEVHISAASSRLNWLPRQFKWIRPYRRKRKSGFCACAITFQMQSTTEERRWNSLQSNLVTTGYKFCTVSLYQHFPWLSTILWFFISHSTKCLVLLKCCFSNLWVA